MHHKWHVSLQFFFAFIISLHAYYMSPPSDPAWFDRPKYTGEKQKIYIVTLITRTTITIFSSYTSAAVCCEPWLPVHSSSFPKGIWPLPAFFFIPIIFKSSSTSSFHLLRGLPPLICSFYSRYCDLFWYSLVLRSLNVTNSLSRRDFTNFTVQCFIWMNSNHMCGAGGATATVSCCLATVQERLQRSSLWADVRTLTKFQIWYYRNTSDASLTFRNLASYI